jgi:hypothetical protein
MSLTDAYNHFFTGMELHVDGTKLTQTQVLSPPNPPILQLLLPLPLVFHPSLSLPTSSNFASNLERMDPRRR